MFEDRTLVCQDCGRDFIFTSGEQEFYHEKGFENEPKRCKECRNMRRSGGSRNGGNRAPREMHTAICASCDVETQVPFKPVEGRPVYCLACFQQQKEAAY